MGAMPWARVGGWFGTALGLVAGVALTCALSVTAQAGERVALVIGNGAYAPHAPNLPNPKKDAAGVGAALARLGFEVTRLDDAGYDDLRRGLLEFEEAAARSEVAVVFYAGHGIEIGGENYLVPVDAELRSDRAVKHEAMRLARVMESVEGASKFRLVILDACRNNPFAASMRRTDPTRGIGRGLARVEPSKDTLVAYAAKEGTTADDGEGDHSPYTEALLRYLEEPGLEVGLMFRKVRDAVWESTGESQLPYTYGSLSSDGVYLAGKGPPLPDGTAAVHPSPSPSPSSGAAAVQGPEPGGSVQPPERRAAEIVLPDGLTLADWALLAEDRLKAGEHARLLEEAGAHLREHGQFESVEAIREQAVSGLVAEARAATPEDVPGALERIARLEAAAGERPEFLLLKAHAHGLLDDHAAEEAAYLQWLRSVPQTHPERRNVLSALARARTAHANLIKRFSELLGRPFSQEWKEDSVGWTDMHYAALLDLPGVIAALCDAGMAADVRLEEDSSSFGYDLTRTLDALGYEAFRWYANGETPLMIASVVDARNAAAALVSCGADMNGRDSSRLDFTPLHYAAWHDSPDVAKLLIDRGADVNMNTGYGRATLHLIDAHGGGTPLHLAAAANALHVAQLLIDHVEDVNAMFLIYGTLETPLDVSPSGSDGEEMRALLRRHGGRCAWRQC